MRRIHATATLFVLGLVSCATAQVSVEPSEGKVRVSLGGEHFTDYIYKGYDKPILYPIIGPHGIPMTRNWPMTEAAEGEAKDHPHHKSLWFTHGSVNGVDFWAEGPGKGKVVHGELVKAEGGPDRGLIVTRNKWMGPDGKTVCTDTQEVVFWQSGASRGVDYSVTLHASEGELVLGDTKEGSMAIRTRPELEINHGAVAVNSEGQTGKDIWGKRAGWVDYSAKVGDKTLGVAMFEHPDNPRFPTWWHAREYGLIAANPFGIHDFEKQARGAGDMKVPSGQSITFRYRFVFHEGDAATAKIAEMYGQYAGKKQAGTK